MQTENKLNRYGVRRVSLGELATRHGIPYPTLYWRFKHGIKNITVAIRKKRG